MKRQSGFTLIELVMVIVILGILSAFALPRFADLGTDARRASVEGAFGAIKSASSIAHAESLVQGTGQNATINLEGLSINMLNGYPQALTANAGGILDAAQITTDDFALGGSPGGAASSTVTVTATGATGTCTVTYDAADANKSPDISIVTSGC